MSRRGPATGVAVVALAVAIATLGAVANLRLLEPHRRASSPIVLVGTTERTTTTASSSTSRSYAVGEAGTVSLTALGTQLDLGSVRASDGWTYEVERYRDDEVEITFRRTGHEGETTFRARLHGDDLRVEIDPDGESPDD